MVKEQEQFVDKYEIPVWRKYTLSVQEAAKYFHIGDKKLRKLIDETRMQSSSCGMVPARRSSEGFLNASLMKSYLPSKKFKYCV